MADCKTCKHKGTNTHYCDECSSDYDMYERKIVTNADRIRAMDDEELAEFINFGAPDCSRHCADFKPGCSFGCKHNHGNDVLIKWLQSEAE